MKWLSDIFGGLVKPVADAYASHQDRKVRIKEAELQVELAKYAAQAEKYKMALNAETDWDLRALDQQQFSWKDEYLTLVFSLPFLGSFVPVVQDYVANGWEYVALAPQWYQVCLLGIVAATFGLRWWFNKKLIKE